MNRANILSSLEAVPVWDVGVIIGIVVLFVKLGHIKELLSNHVTDTTKKIDKLEIELKEIKKDLNLKFEKILELLLNKKD